MKVKEALSIIDDSNISNDDFIAIGNMLRDYEKYKNAIKFFQDNGDQPTRDIIRNLLSY